MSVSAPVARPHSRSAALKAALETSRWLPPPAPSCLSSHSLNNFITRPACSARTSRSCCSVMEGPCLLPWRSPGALLASIASQLSACGLPLTEWSVTERAHRSVSCGRFVHKEEGVIKHGGPPHRGGSYPLYRQLPARTTTGGNEVTRASEATLTASLRARRSPASRSGSGSGWLGLGSGREGVRVSSPPRRARSAARRAARVRRVRPGPPPCARLHQRAAARARSRRSSPPAWVGLGLRVRVRARVRLRLRVGHRRGTPL